MHFINCSGLPTTAYLTFAVTASNFIPGLRQFKPVLRALRVLVTHYTYYKTKNPRVLILGSWLKIYGMCIWSNQDPLMVRDRL